VRQHGESKLDTLVAWEYMMLITDKLIGHIVPVRFALFAFVGGIGLFIHMSVLWFALTVAGAAFNPAQASAAVAAMTSNFFVNNLFTYRDQRLRGFALVRGCSPSMRSVPSARSPMSASPATSFPRTRFGGSPALPARRRIGLELCRLFRLHLEAKITSQMRLFLTGATPDIGRSAGLTSTKFLPRMGHGSTQKTGFERSA
jgi:hypothetical protein